MSKAQPIDWRARAVTTLAADLPAAYPGGPSHKAGTPVVVASIGRAGGRGFDFTTPSQEALAISAAHRAARRAAELRNAFEMVTVRASVDPGPRWHVADESLPALYDFFEACFSTVVFSYQAVEACANRLIGDSVPQGETRPHRDRGQVVELTAPQLQRLPTDVKLKRILPALVGVPPLTEARSLWERFVQLERERDAVVHLKAEDAYPKHGSTAASIFHRFLDKGVGRHPICAVDVLLHLHPGERGRWLDGAVAMVKHAGG